jgi:short-subunit dehydrogenase
LGATSAIARAVAAEYAAHKFHLILAGRDREELAALAADASLRYNASVKTQVLDILDFESLPRTLGSCLSAVGDELEGVILAVGDVGDQAAAQSDPCQARHILDTNLTGCVLALNVVAEHFEKRRKGFICALSSVAGDRGRQSNYLYGAAKGGFSIYLQGLRNRLSHAGVQVTTVKPGFVDTRMTFGHPRLFLVAKPESVARGIYKAVAQRKDVVYLPWFWRYIMLALRLIPERAFKRLRL